MGSHCGDRCRGCVCPGVPTSQTVFGPLLRSYGVQPKRFMSLPRSQLSRDDTDTCILTVSTNRVGPTCAPSRLQPQNRTANAEHAEQSSLRARDRAVASSVLRCTASSSRSAEGVMLSLRGVCSTPGCEIPRDVIRTDRIGRYAQKSTRGCREQSTRSFNRCQRRNDRSSDLSFAHDHHNSTRSTRRRARKANRGASNSGLAD